MLGILLIIAGITPIALAMFWMWRDDRDLLRAFLVAIAAIGSLASLYCGIALLTMEVS